MKNSSFRNY